MKKYMHLLDGRPAVYQHIKEEGMIAFAGKRIAPNEMADSLYQIRKEIELSHEYRLKNKWNDDFTHDYILVKG